MATTTSSTSKLLLLTFLTFSYLTSTFHVVVEARKLEITTVAADHDGGGGNLVECWNAALELKSCTDEIVKFFLNRTGTSEPAVSSGIDEDCCGAIRLIAKDCWSVMFTSLGLTTMEANNLREYCDVQAEKSELLSPAPETLALSPVEITYPGLN